MSRQRRLGTLGMGWALLGLTAVVLTGTVWSYGEGPPPRSASKDSPRAVAGKPSDIGTAAAKPAPILKRSHVAAWFDGPDDHLQYDVDVMIQDMDIVDELEVAKWKAFIDRMHAQGKLFWAEMRPLTHLGKMFEHVMNDPGLQEAVCVDFNLKPIRTSWLTGLSYKGRAIHLYCSNHPRYRAFLRHQIYMFAQAGVDGIMVDDGGGTLFSYGAGGCCCPYCTAGFREYLRGKYTAEQLKARGVEDPGTFDYRQAMLKHAKDLASLQAARQRNEIPLSADFRDFLTRSDAELFHSLQEMACKLSGRHIPMGWDNVDFAASRVPYYPFLDALVPEINYQRFASGGRGDDGKLAPGIVVLEKLSDAVGKWHLFTPAPDAWSAIKEKNLTGLLRLWIAASYANGGLPRYPRKGWCSGGRDGVNWYYPPKEEFEPLYAFVRTHRELFDGYEAVAQVGVLFAESSGEVSGPAGAPLRHVCESLVDLNVPFGILVAGDRWLPQRLSPDDAGRFDLLLIPESARPNAAQRQIVDGWKNAKSAVPAPLKTDVAQLLAGRVDPLVALESKHSVRLFPRTIPGRKGAPVVCHVVNWSYDAPSNRSATQRDVRVRLRSAIAGGSPVTKVTYHTVGRAPQTLAFAVRGNGVHVTVPEVELWGILQLETASP